MFRSLLLCIILHSTVSQPYDTKALKQSSLRNKRLREAEFSLLGTSVASRVTFGRELVLGFKTPRNGTTSEEEVREEVWEHMVLRSFTPLANTPPAVIASAEQSASALLVDPPEHNENTNPSLLGASALAHAARGAAHALSAPPLVFTWLDKVLRLNSFTTESFDGGGTGNSESEGQLPSYVAFSAVSPGTIQNLGGSQSRSKTNSANKLGANNAVDSAVVVEATAASLKALTDLLSQNETTALVGGPAASALGFLSVVRLSWHGESSGGSGVEPGVRVELQSLPLAASPTGTAAAAATAATAMPARAAHRVSSWSQRLQQPPLFTLHSSGGSSGSRAAAGELRLWFSGGGSQKEEEHERSLVSSLESSSSSSSSSAAAAAAVTGRGRNSPHDLSSRDKDYEGQDDDQDDDQDDEDQQPQQHTSTSRRQLLATPYYRALCADGFQQDVDWVLDEPAGCDTSTEPWNNCNAIADCLDAGPVVASAGCKCCKKGFNDAGYVRTQAERAICPCPTGFFGTYGICSDCPPQNAYFGQCTQCPQGQYAPTVATADACLACPDGQYSGLAAAQCSSCVAGQFSSSSANLNMSACALCQAGQYSGAQAAACLPCPGGQYSASQGAGACVSCGAGRHAASEGQTSCAECDAGSYAETTATTCTTCALGRYSAAAGGSVCTACSVGFFANETGSSACSACGPGFFTNNAGLSACSSCGGGTYAAGAGNLQCSNCGSGRFSAGGGASACEQCVSGKYSAAAASLCTKCDAGTYASAKGSAQCLDCSAGKYASGAGNVACEACSLGTSTKSSAGQTSCASCLQGTYANTLGAGSCTSCAVGTYAAGTGNTACVQCSSGRYAASAASSACEICGIGTYSLTGSSACVGCDEGKYSSGTGSGACTFCGSGTFTDAPASSSCSPCSGGQFSGGGATECTGCSAGAYSGGSATSCSACALGKYASGVGNSFCTSCALGTFAPTEGASSCVACAGGHYSEAGASACTDCAAGTYAPSAGLSACTQCSSGRYSGTKALACTQCVGGYYAANAGTATCSGCAAGTYSAAGSSACTPCPAGNFGAISASSSCTACPTGKYSAASASGCTLCAVGTENPVEGSGSCTNCSVGFVAATAGLANCVQCPSGKYQGVRGRRACDLCQAGTFSLGPANATCSQCPDGKTSSAGDSECGNDCAAGTYLLGNQCLDCSVGYYSVTGETSCAACEPGRYAPSEGTPNNCLSSPAGSHAPSSNASATKLCPAGTYSVSGAAACTPCLQGTFSSEGSASCDGSCSAGTYSDAGALECTNCPAGTYSEAGAAACTACVCGSYTTGIGEAECVPCDAGDRTVNNDRTACYACPVGRFRFGEGGCGCGQCTAGRYAASTGTVRCTECDAGKYSGAMASFCVSCLQGWYQPDIEATECLVCSQGKYSTSLAATQCDVCPAGTISFTASTECDDCPAGTFSEAESSACIYCNNGTYSASSASPSCSVCLPGRFASSVGAFTQCTACPKGFAAALNASTSCEVCVGGRYSQAVGLSECTECSAGYVCLEGATKDKEFDCVNATENKPANYYCPAGSAQRLQVPQGSYSQPETIVTLNNRVSVTSCSKTTTCIDGVQNSKFFWYSGNCADGADASASKTEGTASVSVEEASNGLPVGDNQLVISPYGVTFAIEPASLSYAAGGGPFELVVLGNVSEGLIGFQIVVHEDGGLDFETTNSYSLALLASSNGTTINCSMAVTVLDVNEPPTILLGLPPKRNVSEAAELNDYLSGDPMKVYDPDIADEHVYSLVSCDPPEGLELFGIGGCSGRIYVAQEGVLDVLTQPQYNLTIRVKDDAGDKPLQDEGNLTISVLNANDPPYFKADSSDVQCEVPENSPQNTSVAGRNCSGGVPWADPDEPFGDFVVWSITRNDVDDSFQINAATGELSVARNADIDFEETSQYSLEITMTDTGGLSASMDLVVQVVNVNEPPSTDYPALFLLETAAPGSVVCDASKVTTDDPDSSVFTYELRPDGNASAFGIVNTTGELTISGAEGLDFETKSSYRLTVITTDQGLYDNGVGKLSSTTPVFVTVLDVNEQPTLSVAESYYVDEDAPQGSVFGFVYVSDPDIGQTHSFSVSGGSEVGAFAVSASTQTSSAGRGNLLVGTGAVLDYETAPVMKMNVSVSDGSLSDTKEVVVYLNNSNDVPVCPESLSVAISEGAVGLLLPTNALGSQLWSWNFTEEDTFDASKKWGQLSVAATNIASSQLSVVVACPSGTGCPQREASFTLLSPLDYEITPSTSFTATATDGGGLSCSTSVTISVGDENDPPYFVKPNWNSTFYVANGVNSGFNFGVVTADDHDSASTLFGVLTYSNFTPAACPRQPGGSAVTVDTLGTVSIAPMTGALTIANAAGITYPGQICTGVRVTDGGGLSADATITVVTVDANNAPILSGKKIKVLENTPSFTNLTKLVGFDADQTQTLSYAIASCNAVFKTPAGQANGSVPCGSRANMFSVVSIPGTPNMDAWLMLEASQLDYEDEAMFGAHRPPTYELTIEVTDDPPTQDPLTSSALVTILVTDVPEAPLFGGSTFSLLEDVAEGYTVGDVSTNAQDQDAGSSLTFSLDRQYTFLGALTYDSCNSACLAAGLQTVCVGSSLDEDALASAYNGTLEYVWLGLREVVDDSSPFDGDFVWQAPGCDSSYRNWQGGLPSSSNTKNCVSLELNRNGGTGSGSGFSSAGWLDNQCAAKPGVGFTECACEPGPFSIASDGKVSTTTGALNFEVISSYTLPAVCTDDTGLSTSATVVVSLVNVPEAPVVYPSQSFLVAEDVSRGSTVGRVLAYDEDGGGTLAYALLNGTDYFTLSPSEGTLLAGGTDLAALLDFECDNKYVLSVRVTSAGLSAVATVTVLLQDVNDLSVDSLQWPGSSTSQGLATLGGQVVSLVGTNFGPCGGDPSGGVDVVVSATYSNALDGLTYEASGCKVSPTTNTLITCTSAPGVGSGHVWNVSVDATAASFSGGFSAPQQWSAVSSAVSTYASPTLLSITGASWMHTNGGRKVVLNGTNLPPYACADAVACGGSLMWALSGPSLQVSIRWANPLWESIVTSSGVAGSFLDVSCESLVVTVGGTQAECLVGSGVGSDLFWGVTVGSNDVASVALNSGMLQFAGTGFASPSITSLSSTSSGSSSSSRSVSGLSTAGGQSVFLSGDNFGDEFESLAADIGVDGLSAPALVVTYGPTSNNKYTAADCVVVLDHSEVECVTVAGVGANLTWRVGVAGQWGNSSESNATTSYAPPKVRMDSSDASPAVVVSGASTSSSISNAVTGAGVDGGATTGGQLLLVAGVEFGPDSEPVAPVVTYGPSASQVGKYTAKLCQVSVDFTQLSCLTSEGVGFGHWIQVNVGGQLSNVFESNISYATPNVADYLMSWDASLTQANGVNEGARTEGGQWLIINGRNFGTVEEDALTEVRYQSTGDGSAADLDVFYPCLAVTDPSTGRATLNKYYDCPNGYNRARSCLVLTGAVDGPLPGGLPKALEVFVACDVSDLSTYGLGKVANPTTASSWPTAPSFTFPALATATQGNFLYVSYQEDDFTEYFGFEPDYSGAAVANFNGDDALLLYNTLERGSSSSEFAVVDVLGTPNASATTFNASTGKGWGYTDGWVYRRNGTEPGGSKFKADHWYLGHANALDGYATNADALANGVGFPLGVYSPQGWDPMAGCALVDPCPCHVVTDHVAINCTTVAGAGAGHAWVVSVANQESTAATTSYGVPKVLVLSGPGAANASSYGGQEVTLSGANFGPKYREEVETTNAGGQGVALVVMMLNESFLEKVTYGPGGSEYTATDCRVTTAHTEIVCTTVPGVGPTLHWVVTVDKQSSLLSAATSSYSTPSLLGVFPTHVPTGGGSIHVLNGTDLGMASEDSYLQVLLDGVPIDVDGSGGSLGSTVFPESSELMSRKEVSGWTAAAAAAAAAGSSLPRYWEALHIVMPALEDEAHEKALSVVVGNRKFGGAAAGSNTVVAQYKPPRLTEVQNSPGPLEGTQQVSLLLLLGSNFGGVGTVLLGGNPVDASRISSWDDGQIELSVVAASGNITVVVGAYESATLKFDDFSPILFTTLSEFLPDPNGYRTDAKAELPSSVLPSDFATYSEYVFALNNGINQYRNLSLAGVYFGSNEQVLEVTIGEGTPHAANCPIWPGSLVELAIVSSDPVRSITCQLPHGAGPSNRVVLKRSSKSSFLANSSQELLVAYHSPTVTGVDPQRVHTSGGGVVTVTGRNFGSFPRAGALYGSTVVAVDAASFSPTYMKIKVPAGDGIGRELTVRVGGQKDVVYPTEDAAAAAGVDVTDPSFVRAFKYYAPNVTGVSYPDSGEGLPTEGGLVSVSGSDFGLSGSLSAKVVTAASDSRRQLLGGGDDDGSIDMSAWVVQDFEVTVVNSTHDEAVLLIGAGEGLNQLLVNVSGQLSLAPLDFAAPSLTSVNPPSSPTKGGGNVTLIGANFGLGSSFELRLSGSGSNCNHLFTEENLGVLVGGYSHDGLWFVVPEGQCDGAMDLTLQVAGQDSTNSLAFSYQPPTITMLSLDGINLLGSDCQRASAKGCGLDTAGGYTVNVVGHNFGVANQQVLFRGEAIPAGSFSFVSHELASFAVPAGTGAGVEVEVVVGARASDPPSRFSYDPPWITSFTPNEFDANDDLVEIYGNNFGESVEAAGSDIRITIGNRTCGPVSIGASTTSIWQETLAGVPYLWCHLSDSTVGMKKVELFVAGQNLTLESGDSGVRGVCQSGYYGQPAWTVFTGPDVQCSRDCDVGSLVSSSTEDQARTCTAFYDRDLPGGGAYRLRDGFTELSPECKDEWSCMNNAELSSGKRSNCTILTHQDEYCAKCPVGSECADFTTLYSVEPISIEGFWRDATKNDDPESPGFQCDPKRLHRPYCWDLQPCAPSEACKGNNECSKGYTEDKCAQCCDQRLGKLGPNGKNPDCFTDEGEQLLYHRIYGKCEKCPQNVVAIVIGMVCLIILAVLVGRRLQKKKVDLAIFSIGIDYFQVLAIFASTEVQWPRSVEAVFKYMSVFNLSINLTPPECAFEISYKTKWLVVEWFPTVLFSFIMLFYASTFIAFRYCSRFNMKWIRQARNSMISGSLLLMYVLYLNISENTLDPLNCRRIESEDGLESARQFMVSQPSEVCWETDYPTLQQELAPYAFTFFVLYTLGYPALVAFFLLYPGNSEKCTQDQYLRCMGTGSRKETNRAYFNHRSKFATLYFKFKPKYYYWILLIIFRKLCIVTFTLLFHVNATMQLSMILLVIFISYTLQVKHNPYLSRSDYEDILGDLDEAEYEGLVGVYGSCPQPKGIGYEVMLEEKMLKETVMTRHSAAMGGGGMVAGGGGGGSGSGGGFGQLYRERARKGERILTTEELKYFGMQGLSYLFNYNTVESTLLFCAILICLFGIMFASEFTGPGDIMYERLGELVLVVVFISFAYYAIVVWTEVVAVMFPSLELSFVAGAVEGKRDDLVTYDDDGNVVVVDAKELTGGNGGDDGEGYEDSDEELMAAVSNLELDSNERDEFIMRQLEKDVEYEDTNPMLVRQHLEEREQRGGDSNGADEDDAKPVLLGIEEQVALQETVKNLMEEVMSLKKKAATSEHSSANLGGGGKQKKKLKHKMVGAGKEKAVTPDAGGDEKIKLLAASAKDQNIPKKNVGFSGYLENDDDDGGGGGGIGRRPSSFYESYGNPMERMRATTNGVSTPSPSSVGEAQAGGGSSGGGSIRARAQTGATSAHVASFKLGKDGRSGGEGGGSNSPRGGNKNPRTSVLAQELSQRGRKKATQLAADEFESNDFL